MQRYDVYNVAITSMQRHVWRWRCIDVNTTLCKRVLAGKSLQVLWEPGISCKQCTINNADVQIQRWNLVVNIVLANRESTLSDYTCLDWTLDIFPLSRTLYMFTLGIYLPTCRIDRKLF